MSGLSPSGSSHRDAPFLRADEPSNTRTLRVRPSLAQMKHPETILEHMVYPSVFSQPYHDPHECVPFLTLFFVYSG